MISSLGPTMNIHARRHTSCAFLASILLLILMSIGTSPLPPPYHQYYVSGVLERPSGGSRKDFTVILLGKFPNAAPGKYTVVRYSDFGPQDDFPIGITDSTGAFALRASNNQKADSLEIGVVVPDRPLSTGTPFYVGAARGSPAYEPYTSGTESGCRTCTSEPTTQEVIRYYSYFFDSVAVAISF